MPELPEVEAVCERLRQTAIGAEIVSAHFTRATVTRPQRPASVATKVAGRRIEGVYRRAKNVLLRLSGGLVVRVHLRMTGALYLIPDVRFRPNTARAWFELEGGRGLIFDDSRLLGKIHVHSAREIDGAMGVLGPEPLDAGFTVDAFLAIAAKSKQPAKLFLMDQRRVAGLGNIYAAEALFRAKVDPRKPISTISKPRQRALHGAIVGVLREALQSVMEAYVKPFSGAAANLALEGGGFPAAVYGREGEPCFVCRRPIRRIPQGGRSTYFCVACQK
ncbi:MAG: DNA-formamidopyrimidine glycosylase [Bryobacteraceae bacterium]